MFAGLTSEDDVDGYYLEYQLVFGTPWPGALDSPIDGHGSLDGYYEEYVLIHDEVTGEPSDFSDLEQAFFAAGDRLEAEADEAAREMAAVLADVARSTLRRGAI